MRSELPISVVYALPQAQWVVELRLPNGACVADALAQVAQLEPFAALDLAEVPLGIYGEPVSRERLLVAHDRVEIYRPLVVDPKTARRQRAAESGEADAGR
ncbi:MAG: RnfH family protein [Pseudomonadales bacterium]